MFDGGEDYLGYTSYEEQEVSEKDEMHQSPEVIYIQNQSQPQLTKQQQLYSEPEQFQGRLIQNSDISSETKVKEPTITNNHHRDNTVLVIDSLDRDLTKYPNPNEYVIKLPLRVRNAETIELMSLQLTRTETNVNSGNNTFTLSVDNVEYTIVLPIGELESGEELATAITNAIAATVPASTTTFNVTFNRKLIISNTGNLPFSITVSENVSKLLGIVGKKIRGTGVVDSSSEGILTGTRLVCLKGVDYIIVSINDYNRVVSASQAAHTSFITIPMERYAIGSRFVINSDEKERKGLYILSNGQHDLFEIRISFKRPDGSLYDFEGVDHLLTFRVTRHDSHDFRS